MKRRAEFMPLVVTVGQVVVFPYYIIWLKEAALTFTLFAWLFAAFSFSAAFGYRLYQTRKQGSHPPIALTIFCMGILYFSIASIKDVHTHLPYFALIIQVLLGFLQGYFRAWHVAQKSYHLDAVHHYLLVGITMLGLSFVKILSPVFVLTAFGFILFVCGVNELFQQKRKKPNITT